VYLLSVGKPDVLPNSVAREQRGKVFRNNVWWVRVYCANCHKEGPFVIEQHLRPGQVGPNQPTYAHYLCEGCFEKHGVPTGHQAIPDELFWAEAHNVMMEEYGRVLTPPEIEAEAAIDRSPINRLILDRFSNPKYGG
jgi:hypothetical protein